jgi:chaperonin cofactor prefoldin
MRTTGENMDNIEQLQVVVNEVQSARQQLANLRAQVLELETTIEAVKNQPKELALHQQMGGVMVEVSDRPTLLKELEETLGALKQHLERFTEREEELLATYNQLKQMLAESEGA